MENLVVREMILFLTGCVAAGGAAGLPLPEQYKHPAQAAIGIVTLIAMARAAGMI